MSTVPLVPCHSPTPLHSPAPLHHLKGTSQAGAFLSADPTGWADRVGWRVMELILTGRGADKACQIPNVELICSLERKG